ncbi:MAG: hypothetical protein JHC33_08410 [Ignisphaera sp.]|nr:hypothetical protein [Ignisphaera sp.]
MKPLNAKLGVMRLDGWYTIELRENDKVVYRVKKHNIIQPYQYLVRNLLISGSSNITAIPNNTFTPPSGIEFMLEDTTQNPPALVRINASLVNLNENLNNVNMQQCNSTPSLCDFNQMTINLRFSATDNSNNSYSFNYISLFGIEPSGAEYGISLTQLSSKVTKSSTQTLTVIWDATITINSNSIFDLLVCTDPSLKYSIPVNNLSGYKPLMCVNLPYIISMLPLIPYSQIPQNSFLYQTLNILLNAVGTSIQNLNLQGVQYYVYNGTAYPINQPITLTNSQQCSNFTIYLLYGVNNNYFLYSKPLSPAVQCNTQYYPKLDITFS